MSKKMNGQLISLTNNLINACSFAFYIHIKLFFNDSSTEKQEKIFFLNLVKYYIICSNRSAILFLYVHFCYISLTLTLTLILTLSPTLTLTTDTHNNLIITQP